jgi:hypothetical protein
LAGVGDDPRNLVKVEPNRLRLFDEIEALENCLVVEPVAGLGPRNGFKQPAALVEAQGLHAER